MSVLSHFSRNTPPVPWFCLSPLFFSSPSTPHVPCSPNSTPPPTIILHTNLLQSRLAFCRHHCPSWWCVRFGVFPLPLQPPLFTPRRQNSSWPDSVAVVILTTLISLYILGVGGVGWITLGPECTPVPVSQLSVLYLTTTSSPLARIPGLYWVGALTYTDPALPLLIVWSSSTELTMSLKGPRLLSRQGIYHCSHCRFWVSHLQSLKFLQIEPDVLLLAVVEHVSLKGVVRQGPEEAVLFDRPNQE